ncbi:hypothetical protein QZH41_001039 [Actinostola sp. cb2023]|nr:hypothetical protein QZH41_001039 [Actinostola sp. cb2023]
MYIVLEEYVGGGNLEIQLRPNGIPVELLKLYMGQILEALRYLHGTDSAVIAQRRNCNGSRGRDTQVCTRQSPGFYITSYDNFDTSERLSVTSGVSVPDASEPQAPIPEFTFFSGVPGKSRIKTEFEQLEFLGKGGFGNVIKNTKGKKRKEKGREEKRRKEKRRKEKRREEKRREEKRREEKRREEKRREEKRREEKRREEKRREEKRREEKRREEKRREEKRREEKRKEEKRRAEQRKEDKERKRREEKRRKRRKEREEKRREERDGKKEKRREEREGKKEKKREEKEGEEKKGEEKEGEEKEQEEKEGEEQEGEEKKKEMIYHFRYYNSWLEVADENDVPSESEESLSDQVDKKLSLVEPQNGEDLFLELNKFEAPSAGQVDNEQDDSWCSDHDEKNKHSDSESSEGMEACVTGIAIITIISQ